MITKPKYRKVLFVSDIHAPYHDEQAINALCAFAKWWKPNVVVFIGDVVDFYAISRFDKDPDRKHELQLEIDKAVAVLERICKVCPTAVKHFVRGNHEDRLRKYIWNRAEELHGLRSLDVRSLLQLDKLGITYHENGRMRYHGMVIKHGDIVRKFAGYTSRGEFIETGISGVSGHTHRMAVYFIRNDAGTHLWMEIGCLCQLNPSYMEGKTPDWQQGFGIGFYKDGSKRFNVDTVPIINGVAMYAGMEFS